MSVSLRVKCFGSDGGGEGGLEVFSMFVQELFEPKSWGLKVSGRRGKRQNLKFNIRLYRRRGRGGYKKLLIVVMVYCGNLREPGRQQRPLSHVCKKLRGLSNCQKGRC